MPGFRQVMVRPATPDDGRDLDALMQTIQLEVEPSRSDARQVARAGLIRSRAHYDALTSDSCWVLMAWSDDQPVGYALVVRIPKLDGRVGFLYVDELYVLRAHRHQGVAKTLLAAIRDLAAQEELAGVRLLVRPTNAAARALYLSRGYTQHATLLCQLLLEAEQ